MHFAAPQQCSPVPLCGSGRAGLCRPPGPVPATATPFRPPASIAGDPAAGRPPPLVRGLFLPGSHCCPGQTRGPTDRGAAWSRGRTRGGKGGSKGARHEGPAARPSSEATPATPVSNLHIHARQGPRFPRPAYGWGQHRSPTTRTKETAMRRSPRTSHRIDHLARPVDNLLDGGRARSPRADHAPDPRGPAGAPARPPCPPAAERPPAPVMPRRWNASSTVCRAAPEPPSFRTIQPDGAVLRRPDRLTGPADTFLVDPPPG